MKNLLLFLTVIFSSCNLPYQEVIEYFEKDGNPEKLEAAKFLIGNMQFQKHYDGDDYNKFLKKFSEASLLPLWKRADAFNAGNLQKMLAFKSDNSIITSEFLIKHISLCHDIWDSTPWKNDYDFKYFCEYVLPYKSGYEPASLWIQEYHKTWSEYLEDIFFYGGDMHKATNYKKNHMKYYRLTTTILLIW